MKLFFFGFLLWTVVNSTACGQATSETHPIEPDSAEQWYQFRGFNGCGLYANREALPTVDDPERGLLWKAETLEGHSSPIVVDQQVIITGHQEKRLVVTSYDRTDGSVHWSYEVQADELERIYHHGPATPTAVSDGTHIYAAFGSFGAICLDLNGREVWTYRHDTLKNLYGMAASPILVDDSLVVQFSDQEGAALMAFDKSNGEVRWTRSVKEATSTWSTPVVVSDQERTILLVYEPFHLRGINMVDGRELWSVPNLADEPITLPQKFGNHVLVTSYNMRTNEEVIGVPPFIEILKQCDSDGDGKISRDESQQNGSVLSRPDADGEGDHPLRAYFRMADENKDGFIEAKEFQKIIDWWDTFKHANGFINLGLNHLDDVPEIVWQVDLGVPECPTPVCATGLLFAVRNGGVMTVIDLEQGKITYQERSLPGGPYYSSPVHGDGKVYFGSARGEFSVVEAAREPKLLATVDLGEPIWATPALSHGTVFVRSKSHLWAFADPRPTAATDKSP